ncbi:unnamed protein product [Closterium sp. NIES-65]|nr:unnamed protein product [Closterium sp. NIES-65]
MAPPEGTPAVHAAAAAFHGKKPADACPEPVTPKTLFNGVAAPCGKEEIKVLTARTSALRINDQPAGCTANVSNNGKKAAGKSACRSVLDKGKTKTQDVEEDGGYLSDDPDECQDPLVLNEIAEQAGGVPVVISPVMIRKNPVTAMLLKRGRTSFLDGSAFHRVLDSVSGSDTDKIKGLVFRHPGDKWSQQQTSRLTSVSSPPHAAASMKLSSAMKTLLADLAMAFISTGGVREEWPCAQEDCGKAHDTSFEKAVEHVQSVRHGTGLLKAGATRGSRTWGSAREGEAIVTSA